jgi:alpha-tubulin suppressor-like RCC1 family protein
MNRFAQFAILLCVVGLSACGGDKNKSSPITNPSSSSVAVSSNSNAIVSSSLASSMSSTSSVLSSTSTSLLSSSSSSVPVSSSVPASSSSQSSIAPLFLTVTGKVVDELGVPVSSATIAVTGTNALASTALDGSFSVDVSTLTPAILRITKSGFASTIRAAATANDNSFFAQRIVMHSVGATINFDAASDNILRVPGSTARVDLPAGSLANADGSVFNGTAKVTLTPIDPSIDIDFMPGVMVDSETGTAIESLGAMGVEFTDAEGRPLNLGANKSADIRIPATPAPGGILPETIPLYHLNETTGLWEQDGTASLATDRATGKQYYAGETDHFSWWNSDRMFDRATIDYSQTSSAALCNYSALPGNVTMVMQGVDFLGRQAISPKTGEPLYAKALSKARLMLIAEDNILDAIDITMPASGASVSLSRCLIVPQQVTVSGKVTVTSGELSFYRVQISGATFRTRTVEIAADGSYSTSVYANTGAITARLVGGIEHRDTPASSATVTVANANIAFADLEITDDKVVVSGCISGWEHYPHPTAQLNVFKEGKLIQSLFEVNSRRQNFSFTSLINQELALVITPAGSNLHEKIIPIDVNNININLDNCFVLPKAPRAVATINGSGATRAFSAVTSVAGDAPIVKYEWSFGDGTSAEGATVNHTFTAFGSYFVTLKVTDELHQENTATAIPVTVTDGNQTIDIKPTLLSSGNLHSCAVTATGGVKCWGNNDSGQLGNGTLYNGVELEEAVTVNTLSNVVAVSAGGDHSCAITSLGALSCWGRNGSGELGNGSNTDSSTPVLVIGSDVVAVSAGTSHTCALLRSGAVKCWGSNSAGQLGTGLANDSNTPADVIGLAGGAHTIAAGGGHTCAATSGAGVLCWGDNDGGELGNSTTTGSRLPVAVTGLTEDIISLAVGYEHSCAVTAAGAVKCWGANGDGQLGNGGNANSSIPVQVASVVDITLVQTGRSHSCALNSAGFTSCWGFNAYDQLGDDSGDYSHNLPVSAAAQNGMAEAISTGSYNTCALDTDRNVQCWGWSDTYMPGG